MPGSPRDRMGHDQHDDESDPGAADVQPAVETDLSSASKYPWPDEPLKVFDRAAPARGVQLAWIRDGSEKQRKHFFERGYRSAIEAIMVRMKECQGGIEHDALAMPLAFLWRHTVEVKLKDVIRASRELFFEKIDKGAEANSLKSHNFMNLWNCAKPHLALMGEVDEPPCSVAEVMFEEWQVIDPGADGFRYASTRNGSNSLDRVPDHIDPDHIDRSMKGLFNFLDGVLCELSVMEDFFFEHESSMSREYGWPDEKALGRARRRYAEAAAERRRKSKAAHRDSAKGDTAEE